MAGSGSLHSLQFAVKSPHGILDGSRATLVLDADIVYHPDALTPLLADPGLTSVLISEATSGDLEEVRVYGSAARPRFIGKGLTPEVVMGEPCLGEAFGILQFATQHHALARATIDWMVGDPSAPEGSGRFRGYSPARQLTDASAVHVQKLTKLKNIAINGPKITAAWLEPAAGLTLESLNIAQGAVAPPGDAIATIKSIPTLRRLSIDGPSFTDADLSSLAGANQLTDVSISGLGMADARVPALRGFTHLRKMQIIDWNAAADPATEAKVRALLPTVEIKFVH
jgi:hypothetical protein